MIFSSPEIVQTENFRKTLKTLADNIIAVAVDESHCIQKWYILIKIKRMLIAYSFLRILSNEPNSYNIESQKKSII